MTRYAYSLAGDTHVFRLELSEAMLLSHHLRPPEHEPLRLPHQMDQSERVLRARLAANVKAAHDALARLGDRVQYRYALAIQGADGEFRDHPLGALTSCRFRGAHAFIVGGLGHCQIERSEPFVQTAQQRDAIAATWGLPPPTFRGEAYGHEHLLVHDLTDLRPVTVHLGGATETEAKATRRRAPNDLTERLASLLEFLESSEEEWCEVWPSSG